MAAEMSTRARLALYLDLIRWNRPVGWLLPLWCSLASLFIAARLNEQPWPSLHLLTVFTLGTFCMRAAGCCLNDVADQDFDRHVKRTAMRPVTSKRLRPGEALLVGAFFALVAFALVLTTNRAAVAWSFVALAVAIVYPYAKRHLAMPQAVLGIAFSFGIPMAFAATLDRVPTQAWGLLLANFFWVLAYDTEYAMVDRDDDILIGMRTSAITLGAWDVRAVMLFYLCYLALWSFFLSHLCAQLGVVLPGHAGWMVTLAAALAQVVWHYSLIAPRTREGCFKAFRLNHWLGLTVALGSVAVLY